MAISNEDYKWVVEYYKYNTDYINALTANFNSFTKKEKPDIIQFMSDMKVINQELYKIIVVYEKQNEKAPNSLYTVKYGDTLPLLATKFYKDFSKWENIFAANNLNDIKLEVGQTLVIPKEEAELV